MADPLASLSIGAVALVAVGIPLVYLLSRALKLAPRLPALDDPRREARVAVLVVMVVVATSIPSLLIGSGSTTALTDPGMILNVAVADAMLLATLFVAARATRQPWVSLGLSRHALPRLVVLGLVPSALCVPSVA